MLQPASYQALSCLKTGTAFAGVSSQLDRDGQGNLVWKWRKDTSPVGDSELAALLAGSAIAPEDFLYQLKDVVTGNTILPDGGSINFNAYRNRWIMLLTQRNGDSKRGECWYFEGDTPLGPWIYGCRILSFRRFIAAGAVTGGVPTYEDTGISFYDLYHHPEFDKNAGRTIFFEGTWSLKDGNAKVPVPQYESNQVMYKLELDDSSLYLPVPVYHSTAWGAGIRNEERLRGRTRRYRDDRLDGVGPRISRHGADLLVP